MQEIYKTYNNSALTIDDGPDKEEEQAAVLVLELAVPIMAVPVLQQPVSTAVRSVRHLCVSSTVPGQVIQLRVNNTALATGWCTTATLAATGPIQRARL
jgi:hypothetical protein